MQQSADSKKQFGVLGLKFSGWGGWQKMGSLSAKLPTPNVKLLAITAVLTLFLAAGASLTSPDATVCAGGLCQGCYCDQIINGTCFVGGAPSGCIGCVGNCLSTDNCSCRPGVGGCGAVIAWCRHSDCQPQPTAVPTSTPTPLPTATPTAVPTATPTPPACADGTQYIHEELPNVIWESLPDFPVAVHQDPTFRGFDLEIEATAGFAERREIQLAQVCVSGSGDYPAACPGGGWSWQCRDVVIEHHDDPIVQIDLPMRLADSTVDWLNGLKGRYYGATTKEGLPKVFELWDGNALYVKTGLSRYPAQDPGVHGGRIVVMTQGTAISPPKSVSTPYEVKVWLVDSTLGE